ncbi:MAG: DUF4013 domain-containing protein [Methanobrevibacter sp.]|uniref:DUF4013 domain-containing protein n=1 Tax=Methanobrevibacter sp. TaxID=66852 RepID=UPI0025E6B5CB|nr:DUF4013 domain-containing protein [Methanobrevibacter sp.]MBR0271552.1 DUF4013 domain-containing protein [Methanobrevibacter sp.]
MASITDNISEGLKYPFNDPKKLVTFGAFFAALNIIFFAITELSVKIVRVFAVTQGNTLAFKFSQIPQDNVYAIAILAIISFIISLIIMGYQYNVMKFSIDEKNDLPGFSNIVNILINGVKYFIVSLIYNIIPIVVLVCGVELMAVQNGDYIVSIISLILFIICNFLLIMGLANMIDSDKFTKAFDLREITDKIANLGWVRYVGIILFAVIVYVIIMICVGIILMIISTFIALAVNQAIILTAIISIIEGLFISPYISIFFNRVYGSIYRESIQ